MPIVIACVTAFGGANDSLAAQTPAGRIQVGPNVLVGRELDMSPREVHVASAPWEPNLLIGTGIVDLPVGRSSSQTAVYLSNDGGATWSARLMPQTEGDPQVAVGTAPGALFHVGLVREGERQPRMGLFVHRSEDRGATWSAAVRIGDTDHPQVVVDHTGGRFHGRFYVTGLGGCGIDHGKHWYVLCLWHSADQGRTWSEPVAFEPGSDTIGANVGVPLVLHDGTLVVTYRSWHIRADSTATQWFNVRVSRDGGATFSERRVVHAQSYRPSDYMGNAAFGKIGVMAFESWAVDTSGRHRDRLYFANSNDRAIAAGRVFLRYSDDQGNAWSKPVVVDPAAPSGTEQRMPTLGVNKDGVVGLWWFDSRHARAALPKPYVRDVYFSASVNGGATSLPAVRVSKESSIPDTVAKRWQVLTEPVGDADTQSVRVRLYAPTRRQLPGDYQGMATDPRGVFWLLWSDARAGAKQAYAAAVVVDSGRMSAPPAADVDTLKPEQYEIVFAPTRIGKEPDIVEVPFRVINRSTVPWYGSLTVMATVAGEDAALKEVVSGVPDHGGAEERQTHTIPLESVIPGVVYPGQGTMPGVVRIRTDVGRSHGGQRLHIGSYRILTLTLTRGGAR